MNTLIILTISIVLAAGFAVVGLWYGGDMFARQSNVASATKLLNDMNQIRSSGAMFLTQNGRGVAEIDEFVPRYMRSLPGGWTVGTADKNGYITFEAPDLSDEACLELNASLGVPDNAGSPPACPDLIANPNDVFTGCCTTP